MCVIRHPLRAVKVLFVVVALAVLNPLPAARAAGPGLECDADNALARCTLTVTDGLAFEAALGNVGEPADVPGFHMVGDVTLRTPLDDFQLLDSDLVFETQTEGSLPFELFGTARVPLTNLPVIGEYLEIEPMAAVGLVTRETLRELLDSEDNPLPLAENPSDEDPSVLEEPTYMLFFFDSGVTMDLPLAELLGLNTEDGAHDPFSYNFPGDVNLTMVLDPADPYFFVSSAARDLGMDMLEVAANGVRQTHERYKAYKDQQRELEEANREDANDDPAANDDSSDDSDRDASNNDNDRNRERDEEERKDDGSGIELGGIGFSWKGGIPFKPETTWGLPENVGEFKGHLYVETEIPLGYGVSLDGKIVTHMSEEGWELGGNGDVAWGFTFPGGVIGLDIPLGNASAGYKVSADHAYLYLSGILSPDHSFLPEWIPIVPTAEAQVAAFIDSDRLEETRVLAKGRFDMDAGGLGALSGLDLNELFVREGELAIDRHGVFLRGRTASSIHPDLVFGGEIVVEAFFASRLEDSFIELTGDMSIGGQSLGAMASARLDATGLSVEGHFLTPVSAIHLLGEITSRGPRLEGSTSVHFHLNGINQAFDNAEAYVIAAQSEVEKINVAISHMRSVIQSERDRDAEKVRDARAKVNAAQAKVDSIQRSINSKKSKIASLKRQIANKKKWSKSGPWYKRAARKAAYLAYAARKNAEIAALYTQIGALEASKATAKGVLAAAREVLRAIEAGIATIPVDADPRLLALFGSRETALAVLKAAEVALSKIPVLPEDVSGEIVLSLDLSGLRGTVFAQVEGIRIVDGRVDLGRDPMVCIDVIGIGEVCAPF